MLLLISLHKEVLEVQYDDARILSLPSPEHASAVRENSNQPEFPFLPLVKADICV